MLKRLVSLLCVLNLSVGMAFAATSERVTTFDDATGVTVNACLVAPDGEELPCEIISCETVAIPSGDVVACALDGVTSYKTTIKYKTGTNTINITGIDAVGVMTMTWDDVLGLKNVLKSVNGYFEVTTGTYVSSSGILYWGSSDYLIPFEAPHSRSIGQAFDEELNYTSVNNEFGTLWAYARCKVRSAEVSKDYFLDVEVCPTIFD